MSSLVNSSIFPMHLLLLPVHYWFFNVFYSLILLIIVFLTQASYMHFDYIQCKNSLKANSGMYCLFNFFNDFLIQGVQWWCPPALCHYRKITIPQLCALLLIQETSESLPENECKMSTGLKFCSTENIANLLTLQELSQKSFLPCKVQPAGFQKHLTWCQTRLEKLCSSL